MANCARKFSLCASRAAFLLFSSDPSNDGSIGGANDLRGSVSAIGGNRGRWCPRSFADVFMLSGEEVASSCDRFRPRTPGSGSGKFSGGRVFDGDG